MSKRTGSLNGLDKCQEVSIDELHSRENLNGLDKWQGVSIDDLSRARRISVDELQRRDILN